MTASLCAILILFSSAHANAFSRDTGKITGEVMGNDGAPLSFANVILYAAKDSSIVKAEYTNDHGSFALTNVAAGSYWINVSYVGLPEKNTDVFEVQSGQFAAAWTGRDRTWRS